MRPIYVQLKDDAVDSSNNWQLNSRSGDKKFEWTEKANISLLKEEQEIFEQ